MNAQLMGKLGGVVPLVDYLRSTLPELHRATARALRSLSQDRPCSPFPPWITRGLAFGRWSVTRAELGKAQATRQH